MKKGSGIVTYAAYQHADIVIQVISPVLSTWFSHSTAPFDKQPQRRSVRHSPLTGKAKAHADVLVTVDRRVLTGCIVDLSVHSHFGVTGLRTQKVPSFFLLLLFS